MFLTFGNVTRSWRIIQTSRKCIFEWSIEPKMRFLAIFLSLVCWIDLILHIVIVLNVYQLSAMLPGQAGSFKNQKNAFWMIQRAKKEVFGRFSRLVGLIGLVIELRKLRSQSSQRCQRSQSCQRSQRSQRLLIEKWEVFKLKLSMSLHDVTVLNFSWAQASISQLQLRSGLGMLVSLLGC